MSVQPVKKIGGTSATGGKNESRTLLQYRHKLAFENNQWFVY